MLTKGFALSEAFGLDNVLKFRSIIFFTRVFRYKYLDIRYKTILPAGCKTEYMRFFGKTVKQKCIIPKIERFRSIN